MIIDLELGWLAGLLEGEGNFGYTSNTPNVSIRMTDEDTMIKLSLVYEKVLGHRPIVRQISQPIEPRKEVFYIQLYGNNARKIMRLVVHLMCWRRRQQIWRALNKYRAPKREDQRHSIDIRALIANKQKCA